MGDSVETTCFRCGAEVVVMTAGEYLSSSDADLDFVLHLRAREAHLAIASESGAYTCPTCGTRERLRARNARAST